VAAVYGALAGMLFGAMGVVLRIGLDRGGDAEGGAVIAASVGAVAAVVLAVAGGGDVVASELWPFALVGMLVPGASSIVMFHAIRLAGPSRALVVIGVAPLLSVLLAVVLLDEPFVPELALGTVLVVAAGALLAGEARPQHVRVLGGVLALTCAAMFAGRDILARWAAREEHPPPLVATATSLAFAAAAVLAWLVVVRRRTIAERLRRGGGAFVLAGLCLALAYAALLSGLDTGRVTVVAPLNATQSLWGVVFAALLLRRTEAIGRRVVLAAVLVVAGGALIGIFR
jgi:drug/metabolite transporter (DMT)-like permease